MATAAILDFCTNSNNSTVDWRRWMKFCSNVNGCHRKWTIWPKWTKIIDSRLHQLPFWISTIAHNSFAIAHICTKFGTGITLAVLHAYMPKYWTKINLRWMKFCSNVGAGHQKWTIWPKWTKIIISRWCRPPF